MVEQLKEKLKTLKKNFQEAEFEKKVKYILGAVWLLFFSCYVLFSGLIPIMFQFIARVWTIVVVSLLLYIVYICMCGSSDDYEIVEDESAEEVAETIKNDGNNEVVSRRVHSFRKCNVHEFRDYNEETVLSENRYDVNPSCRIRVCNNWRTDTLEDRLTSSAPYYLIETSTFFAMQEYARRRGNSISDIVYGEIPLDDCFQDLAEAIKNRRCYVTADVHEEVMRLEAKGAFESGTAIFIQEDMSIWPKVSSELSYEDFCIIFGKCKARYYDILLTADAISKERASKVWIITSSKKLITLANAYVAAYDAKIDVVNPADLEE